MKQNRTPTSRSRIFAVALISVVVVTIVTCIVSASVRSRHAKEISAKVDTVQRPSTLTRIANRRTMTPMAPFFAPTITATLADDIGLGAKKNPGDTITYTLNISNSGTSDATGINFSDIVDSHTTLLGGSGILATDDDYNTIGNVQITVPAAQGLLANDKDITAGNNTGMTAGPATVSSAQCAACNNVAISSNGSFTYDPPLNFSGTDTFTYTATTSGGKTATATARITVSGKLWFINDNAGACPGAPCNGRLSHPFQTVAAFQAVNNGAAGNPAAGDIIFIYESATSYTGPTTLLNNQKLIGQDATVSLITFTGFTQPSGTDPLPVMNTGGPAVTITSANNGINLGQGNTLRGFTVGATTGAKISGTSFGTLLVGDSTLPDVTLSGNGQALNLTTGTFAATSKFVSVATTSSTTSGLTLTSVAGTVAFGSTTVSGNTAECIVTTSSTADINYGNTSCTGGANGISLSGNTAGTRTFGTLGVSGGSGNAFVHSGGGGNVTVGAATLSSAAPDTIVIQNAASGNAINFAGGATVNKTGAGGEAVQWSGTNTNATLTFATLALTTTNATGMNLSGGGTVNVTTAAGSSISATGDASHNGAAIIANGIALGANFTSVSSTNSNFAGSNGISLTSVTGTSSFGNGSISGSAGDAFFVSGQNGTFTYNGTIASGSAHSVNVTGKTGGTVTFGGAITDTDTGITLTSNTGATINFTGAISATTTTNTAFNATGGGTISATDTTSTLTTTTGTALNVANTTIGASGLNFKSISANGGANGIVLNNTGASGGLTVNGDGANTSVGGNSTGGTIQNMNGSNGTSAGCGIYLNSTKNVVLRRITITGTNQNHGIRGFSVNGFTLEYSTVNGTNGVGDFNTFPDDSGEGSVYFGNTVTTGISTQGTFTNNNISGGAWDNMHIENTSGTATITVKGNTFGLNGPLASGGNISMSMMAHNSGTVMNAVVGGSAAGEPNTFTGAPGGLANFTGQTATTMDVQFKNNVMSNSHPNNNVGGGCLTLATQGVMTFVADSNSMRDADGSTVTLQKASAGTSLTGKFTNNTLGVTGIANSASKSGNGIFLSCAGAGTIGLTITGNSIRNWHGNAAMFFDNTGGSYTANFTITGNTMAEPGAGSFGSMAITNGGNLTSDTVNVCAVIGGSTVALKNTITGTAALMDLYLGSSGQNGGHTFNLPGYAGASNLVNVQNFVTGNNTFSGGAAVSAYDDNGGQGSFTGNAGCGTPTIAPPDDGGMAANTLSQPIGNPGIGGGLEQNQVNNETLANSGSNSSLMTFPWQDQPMSSTAVLFGTTAFLHTPDSLMKQAAITTELPSTGASTSPVTIAAAGALAQSKPVAPISTRLKQALHPVASFAAQLAFLGSSIDNWLTPSVSAASSSGSESAGAIAPATTKVKGVDSTESTQQKGITPDSGETFNASIGTLHAGDSAQITFQVTVDTPPLVKSVSTQGTVSGSNFGSVLTDDPETVTAGDATVTNINVTSTWVGTGTTPTDWNDPTNWNPNTYAPGITNPGVNDVVIPNVGAQPNIGTTDIGVFSLNISNGRTLTLGGTRTLTIGGAPGGNLTLDGIISGGLLNFGAGTHSIANAGGTGSISSSNLVTVLSGATVTLNNSTQMGRVAIAFGGSMIITNTTLSLNGPGTALSVAGTFTPAARRDDGAVGAPPGDGLLSAGSTVVYNSTTGAQSGAGTTYFNLTINNSAGVTFGGDATVNGTLALTSGDLNMGVNTLTQPNTTASTGTGDVVGNCKRTGAPLPNSAVTYGNPNNVITLAGSAVTSMIVKLTKAVPSDGNTGGTNTGFPTAVQRTYVITPTGTFTSATLQLHYLDTELNSNDENTMTLWRFNSGLGAWQNKGATSRDTTNNWVQLTGVTAFSPWTFNSTFPTAAPGTVSGQIVDNNGNPVEGAVVQLSGTQNRKFITDSNGNYRFDNVETNGFYTVTPSRVNYTFSPAQRSFSQLGNTTDAAFSASLATSGTPLNPLDTPEYFVRQQYLDFLGREPDESGFNFWSDQILACNSDAACVEGKRINVSGAFFLSIEFQQTGYLVYRMYQSAYGDMPGAPVPLRLGEFRPDTAEIGNGVVVLQGDWQDRLESNKQAYATEFVQRARFLNLYTGMSDGQFVDTLNHNAGFVLSQAERDQLVSDLSTQAKTRAQALRAVAENATLAQQQFNQAFVLMQYLGYLRRDPNSGPDTDFSGYNFWLDKLNTFGGNFQNAEMVRAFLVSSEYRGRFPR